MRNLLQFGAFLALTCAACAQTTVRVEDEPAPSDAEQKTILARVTEAALKYSRDLPDFVCNKLTRHSADATGSGQHWRLVDSADEELSYAGHKESYKTVTVNGKKAASSGQPASPAYELGIVQSWIFDPNAQVEIKWQSWTTINQRRSYAFAYGVTQPKSQFFVGGPKNRTALGFLGVLYADAETARIMRVIVIGQSPAAFPIKNVTYDLSYDFAKIGDQQFAVPVKTDYRASEGKTLVWTEVEFRRYRKPGSDPADKFETR
jgi:hypothetical protein